MGAFLVRLLEIPGGQDLVRALQVWALDLLRDTMQRPGALPPVHPSIASSQNALDLLTVYKTCVDGKKKDRLLLRCASF